ncbi:hypothetical protein FZEAL_849 [Fusarium zealandicum]|uniref:Uncharacterized protein n=1 Tax=Fusarium zealandicum TaxID=1053134 RepID=A0A8H4UTY0_9HYPO|nr:hypothetical protein FZEAL_849 [Fusarium zealandicum]
MGQSPLKAETTELGAPLARDRATATATASEREQKTPIPAAIELCDWPVDPLAQLVGWGKGPRGALVASEPLMVDLRAHRRTLPRIPTGGGRTSSAGLDVTSHGSPSAPCSAVNGPKCAAAPRPGGAEPKDPFSHSAAMPVPRASRAFAAAPPAALVRGPRRNGWTAVTQDICRIATPKQPSRLLFLPASPSLKQALSAWAKFCSFPLGSQGSETERSLGPAAFTSVAGL